MNRISMGRNLWIAAATVLAASRAISAADALPNAETILDKYIEVTGGKQAYSKLRTETSTGTMEMGGMGLKGSVISYHAEPNQSLVETTLGGVGKIVEGSNGDVAWEMSAIQGARIKEGDEKGQAMLHARFNSDLNWRELYPKTETVGTETVDGKECYKLVLTPKTGAPLTKWYDTKTGLLVKMSVKAQSPMGEIDSDSFISDYRKEGDILVPHKVLSKAGPIEFTMTIESIKYNQEIPKEKFDLPAEIKALQKK